MLENRLFSLFCVFPMFPALTPSTDLGARRLKQVLGRLVLVMVA